MCKCVLEGVRVGGGGSGALRLCGFYLLFWISHTSQPGITFVMHIITLHEFFSVLKKNNKI